jgi:putative DNA primase/helicase
MNSLKEIARALGGDVRGSQVLAPGPGHSHKDRSLSIKLDANAPDGLLVHSFAGDDPIRCKDYVREKLGLPHWNGNAEGSPQGKKIVATYDYTSEAGELLFQVVRYARKCFRQRRPDGNGGWLWSIGDTRRVLYRLPKLLEAVAQEHPILVVEGEKDVESLRQLNVCATTNAGGAGKWRPEYATCLVGADVVLCPDNDDVGRQHMEIVAASIADVAARIRRLHLPNLPDKADVSDWIAAGRTAAELWSLVETAPEWTPSQKSNNGASSKKTSKLICFAEIKPERVDWLWPNRLPRGAVVINTGLPGGGKSQQLCDIAAHFSRGLPWPDGSPCPCGDFILLTAEDALAKTVVPRLIAAGADLWRVHTLPLIRVDARTERAFLLTEDLDELARQIESLPELLGVGIDPITAFLGVGKLDSYKPTDIRGVLGPLGGLAERYNILIYTVTHPPKATTLAINSFIGSQAFIAAARIGYLTTAETDEDGKTTSRFLVSMVKNNLGPIMPTLAYRIEQLVVSADHRDGADVAGSRIVWDAEPLAITAEQALAATRRPDGRGTTATNDCVEFLSDTLANGRVKVEDLEPMARAAGLLGADKPISQSKPFRLARKKLRIKPKAEGFGSDCKWWWFLPAHASQMPHQPQRCPRPDRASLDEEGTCGERQLSCSTPESVETTDNSAEVQ